jgi:hypothetical protein
MKYYYVLSLFCGLSIGVQAQEKINFNPKYKAETNYKIENYSNEEKIVDFKGDISYLVALKRQGITLPMRVKDVSKDVFYLSKKTENKKKTPFSFYYVKTDRENYLNDSLEQKEKSNSIGIVLTGFFDELQKIKINKISGTNLSANGRKVMTNSVEKIVNATTFPTKEMQIGDSFDIKLTRESNITGIGAVEYQSTSVFELVDIKEGKGYFKETVTLSAKIPERSIKQMKFKGEGEGQLIYHLGDELIEKVETSTKASFYMEIEEVSTTIEMKDTTRITTSIVTAEEIEELQY